MMLKVISAAMAATLLAFPAVAQPVCDEADTIVGLSTMVLAKRGGLPRLQARNIGAEAAYLTIRYTPLEGDAAADLLDGPLLEGMRGADELIFAWYVHNRGLAATHERFGEEQMQKLVLASPTTVRALVLREAEDVALNALPEGSNSAGQSALLPIYAGMLDLPDATKQRVAAYAESRGHIVVAASVYATMRDTDAYAAFLSRLGDPSLGEAISQTLQILPIFVGHEPLPMPAADNPGTWRDMYSVTMAAALQPQHEFLNSFFNMTGYIDFAMLGAQVLRDGIASGAIPDKGPMDAGWIALYRALRDAPQAESAQGIDDTLNGIQNGARPLRATAAEVLDWMLAVDALGPYVRAETDTLPEAPVGPTGQLAAQWPEWQRLAQLARSASPETSAPSDELSLAMLAELLFAAGKSDALTTLLAAAPTSFASVGLASDFAIRLDRLCAAYLWHPAESLLLAGSPIYKFDDAGADFEMGPVPPIESDKAAKN